MEGDVEARAFAEPYIDAVAIFLRRGRQHGRGVVFEPAQEGMLQSPTFRLSAHEAQALMDSLWRAGLRPVEAKNSQGVVTAQDAHLQDMRAIVFAKLNISTPGA